MKRMKLASGAIELFLAIPVLGLFMSSLFFPILQLALIIFHIVILTKTDKSNDPIAGHVIGIVANVLSVVPILGIVMRLVAGIVIIAESPRLLNK